jgi:putative glutathione S-transferase
MSEKTSTVEAHGRGRHAAESQPRELHTAEPRSTEPHSTKGAYVTGGEFTRDTNYIEDRITRDGTPGPNGEPGWPRLMTSSSPRSLRTMTVRLAHGHARAAISR